MEALTMDGLISEFGIPCTMTRDEDAPMLWAVWTMRNGEREEIIGAGDTHLDATNDAYTQLAYWQNTGFINEGAGRIETP